MLALHPLLHDHKAGSLFGARLIVLKEGCKTPEKVLKSARHACVAAFRSGVSMQPPEKVFSFEGFTLDLRRGCLRGVAGEIELRPKSFEVLRYLVENAGRLVPKDEIMQAVWRNVIVGDESLTRCVSDIRLALSDRTQCIIKTVPRRGYLLAVQITEVEASLVPVDVLVVPVSNARSGADASSSVARHEEAGSVKIAGTTVERLPTGVQLAVPEKPSIAVLPFQNMSGDPEQEYFADGMVEDITTALSRIPWLFVIARNSSFTYKGQAVDVKQVGRELGVRYVLEGSVRKAGNRVRITGQLIDAVTDAHLWAERFDGSLEDVFELQDKVASSVAGVIEPALQAAETARSVNRPTEDLTAYDLYLRAYAMTLSSTRQVGEALRLLEQAIARDPLYGPALAWAAVCCFRLVGDGRSEDPAADRLKGTGFARRALEVADDDPNILANAALALAYFGEDIGTMMALVDRALELNPSFARGWNVSSSLRNWAGQPDIAIEHMETSLRLSPRARVGTSLVGIGSSHFVSRRFDQAVPMLLRAIQEDPSHPLAYRYLAACYAHLGRLDDARGVITRLLSVTPLVIPDLSYLRNAEYRELFLSGLLLASAVAQ
jgi:TolB-like protein/DNA-binding winged helix-turn-helix (wHTH) protein